MWDIIIGVSLMMAIFMAILLRFFILSVKIKARWWGKDNSEFLYKAKESLDGQYVKIFKGKKLVGRKEVRGKARTVYEGPLKRSRIYYIAEGVDFTLDTEDWVDSGCSLSTGRSGLLHRSIGAVQESIEATQLTFKKSRSSMWTGVWWAFVGISIYMLLERVLGFGG